jgi:hypothetical protein
MTENPDESRKLPSILVSASDAVPLGKKLSPGGNITSLKDRFHLKCRKVNTDGAKTGSSKYERRLPFRRGMQQICNEVNPHLDSTGRNFGRSRTKSSKRAHSFQVRVLLRQYKPKWNNRLVPLVGCRCATRTQVMKSAITRMELLVYVVPF